MDNNTYHSTPALRLRLMPALWLAALLVLAACSAKLVNAPDTKSDGRESAQSGNDVSQKKQAFFVQMKPLVEQENARTLEQRSALQQMSSSKQLSWMEKRTVRLLAEEYRMEVGDQPDQALVQALLVRVDAVPVEMALVQAANESAWGESRFANEGNNYFGQWCYSKGCGIVPEQRAPGATHEVRRFDDAQESVRAYMNNINTTRAYESFRKLRMEQRKRNQPLDAEHLALGLKSYSERGMAYVKIIQAMIRSNRALIASS
ncbi:glucosaminidase domain-containing protein [Mariprofundus aestuarium]|nr:glucosaminidase domain-containing protein [Mariprofundus aestuarium]